LLAAGKEKEYFIENFVDHKFGGVFWSVNNKGERLDTSARLKAQGSAIYAFSELYLATKDEEALNNAITLYKVVEKEFHKLEGGYAETLTRDFVPMEEPKTTKSDLILLEGYTNLYKAWPDEGLRETITNQLRKIQIDGMDDRTLAETCWYLFLSAETLKDFDLINSIKPISRQMGEKKLSHLTDKDPRTKTEIVNANIWLWKYHDVDSAIDNAIEIWNNSLKGNKGFIKESAMHNVRMCINILNIFK
jgi:mannobiose 2-epimerase